MRAVIYSGAGGPEVITIGEVPKPEVRPEHIRVRVHAAGLNRADLTTTVTITTKVIVRSSAQLGQTTLRSSA